MGEKINVKTLTIIILAIIIVLIGTFIVVKIVNGNGNKNYVLEQISEDDYKYFGVITEERCGVIDTKRKYDN